MCKKDNIMFKIRSYMYNLTKLASVFIEEDINFYFNF